MPAILIKFDRWQHIQLKPQYLHGNWRGDTRASVDQKARFLVVYGEVPLQREIGHHCLVYTKSDNSRSVPARLHDGWSQLITLKRRNGAIVSRHQYARLIREAIRNQVTLDYSPVIMF